MSRRALLAVLLAAPVRAAVLGLAPLAPAPEVRLASPPSAAALTSTFASIPAAASLSPASALPASAALPAAPAPAAAAAVAAAYAPPAEDRSGEAPASFAAAAPRAAHVAAVLSARMSADAERLGREFKTLEWRDGENLGGLGDRDPSRIYRALPGGDGRAVLVRRGFSRPISEGKRLPYVLTADGAMDVGVPKGWRERGVKHIQLADGRTVVFAGEIGRVDGRLVIDLNSGTFSFYGMDPRWDYSPRNVELLRAYASALLGEPVDVVPHPNRN